jgi:site-specific recombinase XerD
MTEAKKYFADCKINGKKPRIELIGTGHTSHSFIEYLNHRAAQYRSKGQIVMDRKLRRFAKELQGCFSRDVHFDDLHADSLRTFEAYLIAQDNCNNTRHKKYKFLGEFFAHAMDEGIASGPNPFKKYKIPKEPVKKDKLTSDEIRAMELADLAEGPVNDARNFVPLFLLL